MKDQTRPMHFPSLKHGLLADSLVFSSSRYILLALSVVRNIVVAKVLSPEEYGYWIIVTLVLTYGDLIHLGLRHAGEKEIPFLNGRNNQRDAKLAGNMIYGGILLIATILLLPLSIYALTTSSISPGIQSILLTSAVIVFSDQINRFYLMILRAEKKFISSSKIEMVFEVLRTVSVVGMVYLLKLEGAVGGFLIASVATTLYFLLMNFGEYVPQFRWNDIKRFVAVGIPLFLCGLLYILMLSLDRVFAAYAFSKETLGWYGLASLLAQLPLSASVAFAMVLYPRFSHAFGEAGTIRVAYNLYLRSILTTSYVTPLFVGGVVYSSEFLVNWFLPEYQESLFFIRLLGYGILFLVVIPIPLYAMMAAGQSREYLKAQIIGVVLSSIAYIVAYVSTKDASGIPMAAIASYAIFYFLIVTKGFVVFELGVVAIMKELFVLLIPLVYALVVMILIAKNIEQSSVGTMEAQFLTMMLKLAIYFLAFLPMFILPKLRLKFLQERDMMTHGE